MTRDLTEQEPFVVPVKRKTFIVVLRGVEVKEHEVRQEELVIQRLSLSLETLFHTIRDLTPVRIKGYQTRRRMRTRRVVCFVSEENECLVPW